MFYLVSSWSSFSLSGKPYPDFPNLVKSPFYIFCKSYTSSLDLSYTRFYICLNNYLINICKLQEDKSCIIFLTIISPSRNEWIKCLLDGILNKVGHGTEYKGGYSLLQLEANKELATKKGHKFWEPARILTVSMY